MTRDQLERLGNQYLRWADLENAAGREDESIRLLRIAKEYHRAANAC
jgi:hypothetical protein